MTTATNAPTLPPCPEERMSAAVASPASRTTAARKVSLAINPASTVDAMSIEDQANIADDAGARRRTGTAVTSAATPAQGYAIISRTPPSKIHPVHWISTHKPGACEPELPSPK